MQISDLQASSAGENDSKPEPAESSATGDGEDWVNEEIQSTMIITPDASLSDKEKSKKSGDEFIAQVKKQMSSPEPIGDDCTDPYPPPRDNRRRLAGPLRRLRGRPPSSITNILLKSGLP